MSKKTNATEDILTTLQPLADTLKVAVGELWGIFVRHYVVKGFSELFTAILLAVGAYFLEDYLGWYSLVPLIVAIYLVYDVINLLGNPRYFALEDITNRFKKINDEK